ncbi:hypothetical protein CWE09_13495 [Aliidiomarina minuta]|uniref:Uncharacterized protein n=1 Tax=Aliidiomarina minuta TaxID=880057 RepID=A0A432W196_9GAMM|nr:hypothetical protein [Aliidiomarina minuta]RUO22943.1 hypothetical protein CWE09_13495 [Aliidiomarina minuta]
MTPRSLLYIPVLCIVAACSAEQPQVLHFQPDNEEERRYQFVSTSHISSRDAHDGEHSERIQHTEFKTYRVSQRDADSVQLNVQPDYLHAQADSGVAFGSVLGATTEADRVQLGTLAQGRDIEISFAEGRLLHASPEAYTRARLLLTGTLNQIQEVLAQPGLVSGMALEAGASRTIKENRPEGVPGFSLTLGEVRQHDASFTIEGDTDSGQVYGRMWIDRETGWLNRAGVVLISSFRDDGYQGEIRTIASITQAEWPYAELMEHSLTDVPIDFSPQAEDLDHLVTATEESIFAESQGTLQLNGDRFTLTYSHPLEEADEAGQFSFTQMQAFDEQGELLDLELQALRPYSYHDGDQVLTIGEVFPLGWENIQANLDQVHSIEAEVQWFPQELQLIPIDVPQQGSSELEHGNARARLQATENPREFDLYLYPTQHKLFGYQVYGAESGVMHALGFEGGPDWLNEREREVLNVLEHGEFPTHLSLQFRNEVPQQLRLVAFSIEQEAKAQQKVRFAVD